MRDPAAEAERVRLIARCAVRTIKHQWCCGTCHERSGRVWVRCYECGHPYRTRWHLLAAYRVTRWRLLGEYRSQRRPASWWRAVLGGWWRPSRISFCQCCSHDL